MKSIGLLLPRSTFYASISFDIFEGFRAALRHLGKEDVKIVSENIGFGAEKQECYRAAERLLLHENVPVVFAYIGHRTAQLLRPLFMAANKLLIVLDAGSHLPQEWPTSPNIFYHSLHNALGAWLSAQKAIAQGYIQGGVSSGFYDGGYLQTYALHQGFQKSGGNIVFNHATGYRREDFSLVPLKNYLSQYPQSCLLALFSADFAQWFLQDLVTIFPDQQPQVFAAPFSFEESMLDITPFTGQNLQGIAAWSRHLDTEGNRIFVSDLQKQGRQANLFSLLGWEAAFIAIKVLDLIDIHYHNTQQVSQELKSFSFEGPRGKCWFHANTQYSLSPLFEAMLVGNAKGTCAIEIQSQVEVAEPFEDLISEPLDNAVSGWYNSYACI